MAEISPIIETLENRWMRAWVTGDIKTLRALTSSNFRMVIGSKPAVILDLRSWMDAAKGRYRCKSFRFGGIYARRVGSTAVFASQLEMKSTLDGEDWSGEFWVTDIWRRGRVRRSWRMTDRILSRPDDRSEIPGAVKSLQLWR